MKLLIWPIGRNTNKLIKAEVFSRHQILGFVDDNVHKRNEIEKMGGWRIGRQRFLRD